MNLLSIYDDNINTDCAGISPVGKIVDINVYWYEGRIMPSLSNISSSLTEEQSNAIKVATRVLTDGYNSGDIIVEQKEKNIRKIDDIVDVWNKENEPISDIVIKFSKVFIMNVSIQPKLYPTGRNSVQMEYELDDGSYLEFEIFEDKMTCMIVPKRKYKEATFPRVDIWDIDKINSIIGAFYGIIKPY